MLQNIFDATLNTIFVSIPEEFVWVVCVLALLKRMDLLDIHRWKSNIQELMIVVLPVAISVNLMRYILHINNIVNFIIIEIMISILMIYLIKRNNFLNEKINFIKIVFCVLLVDLFMNFAIECMYGLLLMIFVDINTLIANSVYMNIILSLFPRTIQVLIIVFYLYKKNIDSDIKFLELILKDKVLGISLTSFLLTLVITFYIIFRFIIKNDIFVQYAIIYQVLMNLFIIAIPIILIVSCIIPICHLLVKNIETQKTMDNMFFDDVN